MEDERSLREAIADVLYLKKFLVIEARNGKEGVELALAKHPDLILLDQIMPEMDGMTALKKIREDVWGATVPVIVLTNLSVVNEELTDEVITSAPVYRLIKSDWKIHDVLGKIEDILKK